MCLALPGLLETIDDDDPLTRQGKVRFGGVVRTVHLALVPEAVPGDHVLVHVGVALSVVDALEVERLQVLLDQLEGETDEPVACAPSGDQPFGETSLRTLADSTRHRTDNPNRGDG